MGLREPRFVDYEGLIQPRSCRCRETRAERRHLSAMESASGESDLPKLTDVIDIDRLNRNFRRITIEQWEAAGRAVGASQGGDVCATAPAPRDRCSRWMPVGARRPASPGCIRGPLCVPPSNRSLTRPARCGRSAAVAKRRAPRSAPRRPLQAPTGGIRDALEMQGEARVREGRHDALPHGDRARLADRLRGPAARSTHANDPDSRLPSVRQAGQTAGTCVTL